MRVTPAYMRRIDLNRNVRERMPKPYLPHLEAAREFIAATHILRLPFSDMVPLAVSAKYGLAIAVAETVCYVLWTLQSERERLRDPAGVTTAWGNLIDAGSPRSHRVTVQNILRWIYQRDCPGYVPASKYNDWAHHDWRRTAARQTGTVKPRRELFESSVAANIAERTHAFYAGLIRVCRISDVALEPHRRLSLYNVNKIWTVNANDCERNCMIRFTPERYKNWYEADGLNYVLVSYTQYATSGPTTRQIFMPANYLFDGYLVRTVFNGKVVGVFNPNDTPKAWEEMSKSPITVAPVTPFNLP